MSQKVHPEGTLSRAELSATGRGKVPGAATRSFMEAKATGARKRLPSTKRGKEVSVEAIDSYVYTCLERATPPRVSELARTLGVSRRTLMKDFRQLEKMTPSGYLKRKQIARAKLLLLRGWSVQRCAFAAGFGTPRSFFRSFRAIVGMTPAAYRRRSAM
jgi:AraC-like DNA-binding protein